MNTVRFKLWSPMYQCYIKNSIGLNVSNDGTYQLEANDYIVILPTGLYDKNGKEIWTGDIVSDVYDKGVMVYDIKTAFRVDFLPSETELQELWQSLMWAEVIGNIYENPELLEEK